MLNNVRMDDGEINTKGDFLTMSETMMVQNLSMIADAFVNDAFACAHRQRRRDLGAVQTGQYKSGRHLLLPVQQLALCPQRLLLTLLPRALDLGRLEAVGAHLDLLRLRVVALLRQSHLQHTQWPQNRE